MGGSVRYYGPDHQDPSRAKCGVELDAPLGKNDGTVRGHAYFSCTPSHGVLVRPKKVMIMEQSVGGTSDVSVLDFGAVAEAGGLPGVRLRGSPGGEAAEAGEAPEDTGASETGELAHRREAPPTPEDRFRLSLRTQK